MCHFVDINLQGHETCMAVERQGQQSQHWQQKGLDGNSHHDCRRPSALAQKACWQRAQIRAQCRCLGGSTGRIDQMESAGHVLSYEAAKKVMHALLSGACPVWLQQGERAWAQTRGRCGAQVRQCFLWLLS